MNGYQRVMAALSGEWPDRVPVMLHNFMHAARESGVSMGHFRSDAKALSGAFVAAVETYGYDGILVDVDTATLAGALGAGVVFPDNEPARVTRGCVEDIRCVDQLGPTDVASYPVIQTWLEAVERLRGYFGDEILIRGNCDQCAFSLASMVRGTEAWMLDLLDAENVSRVFELLDFCHEATARFVELMSQAGAHVISNGDSPAGPSMISPRMYREFAWPYEEKTVRLCHEKGLPYILHICGNTEKILEYMVLTGADGLELDYKTDALRAREVLNSTTFFGNLDPVGLLARGSVQDVRTNTLALLRVFEGTPRFVLNSGCAIPPETPSENIQAMIRTAREFR